MKTIALRKIGNSQGIILEKTILDLVGADPENVVFELKVNEQEIMLRPLSKEEQKRMIKEAAQSVSKEQEPILKKLSE